MPGGSSQGPGAGSAAGAGESSQSFAPDALRSGVTLRAGTSARISVRGMSGRPLPGGRSARSVHGLGEAAGTGAGSGASGANGTGAGGAFIHLVVKDPQGAPKAGAEVLVYHAGSIVARGHCDDAGSVHIAGLPAAESFEVEIVGHSAEHASAAQ